MGIFNKIPIFKKNLEEKKECSFSKDNPLAEKIINSKTSQQQPPKKIERVSIAKEEKKKSSTYINLVDIALDSYEDIFSDFDQSPYAKRQLSEDFVNEVERRYSLTKGGRIEVVLSVPKKIRNTKDEIIIKERIKEYFDWKISEVERNAKEKQKLGGFLIGAGVAFITISNIIGLHSENSLLLKILHELTLIPGWVGEFVGIEKLLIESNEIRQKKKFYEKFRDATYIFIAEEDIVKKLAEATAPATQQKESEMPKEQRKEEL